MWRTTSGSRATIARIWFWIWTGGRCGLLLRRRERVATVTGQLPTDFWPPREPPSQSLRRSVDGDPGQRGPRRELDPVTVRILDEAVTGDARCLTPAAQTRAMVLGERFGSADALGLGMID